MSGPLLWENFTSLCKNRGVAHWCEGSRSNHVAKDGALLVKGLEVRKLTVEGDVDSKRVETDEQKIPFPFKHGSYFSPIVTNCARHKGAT